MNKEAHDRQNGDSGRVAGSVRDVVLVSDLDGLNMDFDTSCLELGMVRFAPGLKRAAITVGSLDGLNISPRFGLANSPRMGYIF